MKKLSLSEWAQVGEVVGMVAVVLSLLMVVYSLNQNTEAIQGETGNLIFERHAELSTRFMSDESLAAIVIKMRQPKPQLTDVEAVRWEKYILNLLDIWAMGFSRHQQGLLTDLQWDPWDSFFATTFSSGPERISKEQWKILAYGYDPGFWNHVAEKLFADRES
jgi:hypothetical protein